MTAVPARVNDSPPSWRHTSLAEYRAFIHAHIKHPRTRMTQLGYQRQFVKHYPDLRAWFQLPLAQRVGCLPGENRLHPTCRFSYQARPYLLFLVTQGAIRLDWDWLLAIAQLRYRPWLEYAGIELGTPQLLETATALGYRPADVQQLLTWLVPRLYLRTGHSDICRIGEQQLAEGVEAIYHFGDRADVSQFYPSADYYRTHIRHGHTTAFHTLQLLLYHQGQITTPPRQTRPPILERPAAKPRMQAVVDKYLAERRLQVQPHTLEKFQHALNELIAWCVDTHPAVETFAEMTRDHLLEFAAALTTCLGKRTNRPLKLSSQISLLSRLAVFFADVASWGWDDVPIRPLLIRGDFPKLPERIPRYIPDDELDRLMAAIRSLECPLQRASLLIARWSGARRDEIRRLARDCLDQYGDGTPRLRIPAGKTKRERLVPINEEAAAAIRVLQTTQPQARGLPDRMTGVVTEYLFMHRGKLRSLDYLFNIPLLQTCMQAGLVDADGKATITAHRFRHTVGKQLAEKGAKLRTIMTVLGHSSVDMSMVYAHISDLEVLKDYRTVLGSTATIAGPFAETIRLGGLSSAEVDWLKTNFFKTELELGHCLRLPQEGPCECDLYLTCAKFVTTPDYAPRLRRRRKLEQRLIEDASSQGWQREVERHGCTVNRIEQLLSDLGEPIEGQEATESLHV
jgi:integrase